MSSESGVYCAFAAFGLLLASVLIDVSALIVVKWRTIEEKGIYRGLWRQCVEKQASNLCTMTNREPAENAAIAFIVLAFGFKIPVFGRIVLRRCKPKNSARALTVLPVIAGVWNLIAVAVYGASPPSFVMEGTSAFGLGFDLAIGNTVVALVAAFACWIILRSKDIAKDDTPDAGHYFRDRGRGIPLIL